MKIGSMMSDVVKSFFRKPVTVQYPFDRKEAPENFRGKLKWDLTNCTGCQLCVKDCPADAIELIVIDRAKKRFIIKYEADKCIFCEQCVVNCRFNCLDLTHTEWELGEMTKEPFTVYYGREEDVQAFLQQVNEKLAE